MQDESLAASSPAVREEAVAAGRQSGRGPRQAPVPPAPQPALPRVHVRVRHGLRRPHNWVQLVKFCLVGGSGFVVNLTVFTLAAEVIGFHHLAAAGIAYVVAVTNNFLWNRYWTFRARHDHPGFQAARFFTVSTSAALLAAAILELLVSSVGVPEVPAQAISIVMATPLNFIGNKMWSFGRRPMPV
jgi:putative flippase GtrA